MSNPYAIGRDGGAKSDFMKIIGGLLRVLEKVPVISPLS
jgi:hypothetical protein